MATLFNNLYINEKNYPLVGTVTVVGIGMFFYLRQKYKMKKIEQKPLEQPQMPLDFPIGNTALWIASVRAMETRRDDGLFKDPFAEKLAGKEGDLIRTFFESGFKDRWFTSAENSIKLQRDILAIRTKIFDDFLLEKSREMNNPQVVIIAAGLDSRSLRLDWPNNTTVFEVDFPEVLEWKNSRLDGASPKGNTKRICVGVDLTSDHWENKLKQSGYDPSSPSVWLAEGLLIYLPEDKVKSLLKRISNMVLPKSWFSGDLGNNAVYKFSSQTELMKKINAPWLFGTDYPEDLLKSCGWSNPNVGELGEPRYSYGRIPFKPLPRWFPFPWPRGWYLHAQK